MIFISVSGVVLPLALFCSLALRDLSSLQVSSQMEKKTKVTIKRKTYFDEQDSDDNDDDMM